MWMMFMKLTVAGEFCDLWYHLCVRYVFLSITVLKLAPPIAPMGITYRALLTPHPLICDADGQVVRELRSVAIPPSP